MQLLQFSGRLDSLACLILLHDTAGLNVLTASTDGAYPERAEYLAKVQAAYPQVIFHHVSTDRRLDVFGRPVDVVPLRYTALGQYTRGKSDVRYQDAFSCCGRNLWTPLERKSKELGATTIYRGQRNDDRQRNPEIVDGADIGGITYRLPIEHWTRERVIKFVAQEAPELVPESYWKGEKTSRDCVDCTAYLEDNETRINNLPLKMRIAMQSVLGKWRSDVMDELGEFSWTA